MQEGVTGIRVMWYFCIFFSFVPVAIGILIHTTWEGSGFHLPSSPHTELVCDEVNPDC